MADPELKRSTGTGGSFTFGKDTKKEVVSAIHVEPSTDSTSSGPVLVKDEIDAGNDQQAPDDVPTVPPPAQQLETELAAPTPSGPEETTSAEAVEGNKAEKVPTTVVTTTTTATPEKTTSSLNHDAPKSRAAEEPPLVVVAEDNGPDQVSLHRTKSDEAAEASEIASVASAAATVVRTNAEDPQRIQQQQPQQQRLSVGGATAPPSLENHTIDNEDDDDDDGLDEFIKSPHGQNAIVERSPGGRYVRFMEKLGSGASKDVYRAYDTQEGIEVAWNVVSLSGVPKTERNRIVNEVRLLERLHHHNIISFHGSWVNRERQEVHFVTEILSSGTLKSFINKVQVIRWKIAKRWAVQILKGLEYLHSQDPPVIHRDLKCDNIFINGTSGDLRIGDLGLSTVHRNGRVLSVLGTPEFMAPDMYEDTSYDQKVDIYAFGMCMLEIFTKEIPYKECKNPAQIYKKVSNGELPEILSRLQSRHARDFIMLCMGYKDENGVYVRPTATELLKHEFLIKRVNDDDEVMVDPPLIKRTILENESLSPSNTGMPSANKSQNLSQNPAQGQSETKSQPGQAQAPKQQQQPQTQPKVENATQQAPAPPKEDPEQGSVDGDESDRFDEMPDSEVNFRKVKVLMGRGQELKEEDEDKDQEEAQVEGQPRTMEDKSTHSQASSVDRAEPQPEQAVKNGVPSTVKTDKKVNVGGPVLQVTQPGHYLVAAAVIEHEAAQSYPDEILKLVVTLPVEGQTQNVQFDFHLIEDDPVQVAKEMVAELGIPQGAILEISETISGLACAARMQRDKYKMQAQQNAQGQIQAQGHLTHSQRMLAQQLSGGPPDMQQGLAMQQQAMQQQAMGQQANNFQGQNEYPTSSQGMHTQQPQHVQPPQHVQQQQQHHRRIPSDTQSQPGLYMQNQPPMHQQQQHQMQGHPNQHGNQGSHVASDSQSQPANFGYDANQSQMPQHRQMHSQQAMGQHGNQMPSDTQSLPPTYNYEAGQQHPLSDTSMQAHPPSYGYDQGQHQGMGQHQQQHQQTMQSQHIKQQQQGFPDAQNQANYGYTPQQQNQANQHMGQQGQQGGQMAQPPAPHMQQPQHQQQQYQHNQQPMQGQYQHNQQSMQGQHQHQGHDNNQNRFDVQPTYQGQNPYQHATVHQGQPMVPVNQGEMQGHPQPYSQAPQGSQQQQQQQHIQSQPQQQQQQQPYPQSPLQHTSSGHPINSSGGAYIHGISLQNANSQRSSMPTSENSLKRSLPTNSNNATVAVQRQATQMTAQGPPSAPNSGPVSVATARSAPDERLPPSRSSSGHVSTPLKQNLSGLATQLSDEASVSSQVLNAPQIPPSLPNRSESSDLGESSTGVGSDSEEDPDMTEELRRLDEDFQKNLHRAKKVFDNRMDNLQRSQIEREAQHQKTLEKHQKERAEFEKRLAQEEREQNRRIEQLQREWDQRRQQLARCNRRTATEEEGTMSAEVSLASSPDMGCSLPASMPSDNLAAEQFSLNQTESSETMSER